MFSSWVLYSNVLSLLKRNNGAGWHVCKVGSDVWMEYFAVPHTLAADHIIPCYWGHIAQEWCDAFGRLFLTLKQTNVCILTVETYIQGSTWLQVNILSIQVATQQAAVLVALRPSFCLFVFFVGRWCSCVCFNHKVGIIIESIYLHLSRLRQTSQPKLLFLNS